MSQLGIMTPGKCSNHKPDFLSGKLESAQKFRVGMFCRVISVQLASVLGAKLGSDKVWVRKESKHFEPWWRGGQPHCCLRITKAKGLAIQSTHPLRGEGGGWGVSTEILQIWAGYRVTPPHIEIFQLEISYLYTVE